MTVAGGADRAEALRLVGALEHASEHPIGPAIAPSVVADTIRPSSAEAIAQLF